MSTISSLQYPWDDDAEQQQSESLADDERQRDPNDGTERRRQHDDGDATDETDRPPGRKRGAARLGAVDLRCEQRTETEPHGSNSSAMASSRWSLGGGGGISSSDHDRANRP